MKVVSAGEMRVIEQRAAAGGTPIAELANRAGRALADAVWQHWPGRECLILAGPGNNGADGEIAASSLRHSGATVTAYTLGRTQAPDGREPALTAEEDAGLDLLRSLLDRGPVVVDCLLGTGASRPPQGLLADVIRAVNDARVPVLAADIPTGVDPDTGAVLTVATRAERTLTFGFPKVGTVVYPGAEYAGCVEVVSLGIASDYASDIALELTSRPEVAQMLPRRVPDSNKGTYGTVLVIGGSTDFPGAPGLTSIAALRAGAGLAHAVVLPLSQRVIAAHALEPVYSVVEAEGSRLGPGALPAITKALSGCDSVVMGPGMGVSDGTGQVTQQVVLMLRGAGSISGVVDADALNVLAKVPEWWTRAPELVLTPHPGEMSRLTGRTISDVQSDRVGIAREFAALWGSVVVLKGARTVIADPEGRTRINPTGGPNLATAGTGDVLSGIIGGLLAQKMSPWESAVSGVYIHGLAGDRLMQTQGDAGTLAGDLLNHIPRARVAVQTGDAAS